GPNADSWVVRCGEVCRALDIPLLVTKSWFQAKRREAQAAARQVRHAAPGRTSTRTGVLLAHHADDQAETILHNLLRGAGVRGAAAIPELGRAAACSPVSHRNHRSIRPVVVGWIEDESNLRHPLHTKLPAAGNPAGHCAALSRRRRNQHSRRIALRGGERPAG
ncbi:MAG: hypothetical protein IPN05_14835, partial [Sulfuritalea sp.]|nr:hypothetical protein [Sulfuritalea sp.]